MKKQLIYFLCTGNSCRSQMADGFFNDLMDERFEVKSAGLEAHGLNSRAVMVMKEVGVDISNNTSNVIDPEILNQADYVITLCGHADEHCPVILNQNVVKWHWGFDDPAKATGTEEQILANFREVRDAIRARIHKFVEEEKNYQSLVDNKIFMGSAADVEFMIKNEQLDVVIDLRGEATESAFPSANTEWINIPLGDHDPEIQADLFKKAIDEVVKAYKSGKKVGFHCGGGKGRTGVVAAGTLLALGLSNTLDEAEEKAKSIRPVISIRQEQREALNTLFPS